MPRAVAIMPTADRGDYISLAIRCFQQQTVSDKLLVVVDNGASSINGMLHLLPEQIVYHRVEPSTQKLSHGAMMNLCCSLASPDDVIFAWDDDDWSAPTRMHTQLDTLATTGKSVTGYHNLLYYNTTDGLTYRYDYNGKPLTYACGSSQAFTYEFWSRNPFMAKPRGADGDFSRKAKDLNELVSVPGVDMLVARAHAGNIPVIPLGSRQFPVYPRDKFPQAFFDALLVDYGSEAQPVNEPRALIGITASHRTGARREIQRSTWLPLLPARFDYRYFQGEPRQTTEPDIISLPVPDLYADLTLKTLSMIRYAYESGYTHIFKCDDDTFIVPDRLITPDCDYTGHCRKNPPHNDGVDYCHGGRGYWLSRKAMKAVLAAPVSLFASGKIEDGAVAHALKLAGILPVHDERYTAEPHTTPTADNDAITCHTRTPAFMTALGGILARKDHATETAACVR